MEDALIVRVCARAGKAQAEQRWDCRNFRLVRKLKEMRRGVPGWGVFPTRSPGCANSALDVAEGGGSFLCQELLRACGALCDQRQYARSCFELGKSGSWSATSPDGISATARRFSGARRQRTPSRQRWRWLPGDALSPPQILRNRIPLPVLRVLEYPARNFRWHCQSLPSDDDLQ